MAELAGGSHKLLQHALEALQKGKDLQVILYASKKCTFFVMFQWGLELSAHALYLNPKCVVARKLKILLLRHMASLETSAASRNWFLTAAKELADTRWFKKAECSQSSLYSFFLKRSAKECDDSGDRINMKMQLSKRHKKEVYIK